MKDKYKTLSDINFEDKTVLLRTDLNSDVKNKRVLISERIKEARETIAELKKKKAKIVILAHQGNPGKENFLSLKQHFKFLKKYIKIKFVPSVVGKKAVKEIKNLKKGEALLLENIRFERDEFKPEKKNNKIIKTLVPLADIYVNDAFSVCHRNHTSIVSLPKYLRSCIGRIMERELKALEKAKLKNCLYILGGAKPEDNLKLLGKGRKILVGGIFGQMCLIARGFNLGKENEEVNRKIALNYDSVLKKLKSKLKHSKIITPIDYAVEINGKRKEISLEEFPTSYVIYDIGKKTQELFKNEIKKASSVYMKGPLGFTNKKNFREGTLAILKAISESNVFSIIGGGHLSDAIKNLKIQRSKFNHISLSGGALLRYIAGEKLPGLEALKKNQKIFNK